MIDAVVFGATLEVVPRVDVIIDEATRVLRPDGMVVALILNTRSAYVQSNLQREGLYFQRLVYFDADALTRRLLGDLDGLQEFLLGIDDETVIERSDPDTAAVTAVVGAPCRIHNDLGVGVQRSGR